MEKTLVLIKPDGVERRLIGEVIKRFEQKGLRIAALKMLKVDAALSKKHYFEHAEKFFYPELEEFITSGPVVAIIIEGANAVKVVRLMVGATNSAEALPGTIRGDLSLYKQQNIIHASDSQESAEREIANFFSACEIF